jgi:hypothetical protein
MKGTYLAAALILMIGYLAIRLADARMNLEPNTTSVVETDYNCSNDISK